MFCENCGVQSDGNAKFCENCGAAADAPVQTAYDPRLVGFSQKIRDPAFENLQREKFRKSVKHGFIFLPVLILLFQIVPFFAGDFTRQRAFTISCVVGGFGMLWTLAGGAARVLKKTWDGEVIDKKITEQRGRNDAAASGCDIDYYHAIVFKLANGRKKKMRRKLRTNELDAWDMMIYLNIGDRVRYHGKLDYYEKYDKSRDAEVPCANCRKYIDIRLEYCPVCQAPVIKP